MEPKYDSSFGYVLYVDEAGDEGLRSFKPENPLGSTEWLVLAGYLVRVENDTILPSVLAGLRADISASQGRALHFRDLSPTKRIAACKFLAKYPARAFAVCSYKRTMQNHSNPRAEAAHGNSQYLYNFLIRHLLERVTDFCEQDQLRAGESVVRPLKVIFSHKGGHRYGQMKAYLELLKLQAVANSTILKARQIRPQYIRFNLIEYHPHFRFAGLQLADVVASAVYQGVDTSSRNWSCKPAKALAPIIAGEELQKRPSKVRADYGLTLIPRPEAAQLPIAQQTLFKDFGYIFGDRYRYR